MNDYIERAKAVHGLEYMYRKTEFVSWSTRIIITCRRHGDFDMLPRIHLRGSICYDCELLAKKEYFLERAIKKHNNKYNYDKVVYVNMNTKVIIKCPIHGNFEQLPTGHMKQGCRDCGIKNAADGKRKTPKQFIKEARQIHGDKYDYSLVVYNNSETPVSIICDIHGLFNKIPNDHIRGSGCAHCARQKSRKTYSKAAIDWIESISKKSNIDIEHAENGGEHSIKNSRYRADGYCAKTNTVYEYNGCIYHGCRKCFNQNEINGIAKKPNKELYARTLKKQKFIKDQGYKLVVMWEHTWKAKTIQKPKSKPKSRLLPKKKAKSKSDPEPTPKLSIHNVFEIIMNNIPQCLKSKKICTYLLRHNIDPEKLKDNFHIEMPKLVAAIFDNNNIAKTILHYVLDTQHIC